MLEYTVCVNGEALAKFKRLEDVQDYVKKEIFSKAEIEIKISTKWIEREDE